MSKISQIVEIVDRESPGLLDDISREDGLTKEDLVRKVISLSHGQMVRAHQNLSHIILCNASMPA